MNVSWTVRILLVVTGLFIGFIGFVMWADEAEHGGWAAVEGYEEGYLFDGSVEVRQVPWSINEDQLAGAYEVRLVEGDTYEVAFIDRQGEVMFTGSSADVAAWLDEQGEQVFVGSRAETTAWLDEQRSGEKNYVMPGIVIGIGLLLVLIALVPTRRPTEPARDLVTSHPRGA